MDVDIDVVDKQKATQVLKARRAALVGEKKPHASGVYLQPIPMDPLHNLANIDYKTAEDLGFFKFDLLNNSLYAGVKDRAHLERLVDIEPMWELLEDEVFVESLFHIGKYAKLVVKLKPTSVDHLAMILAIIRPAKAHLQHCTSWDDIEKEVWVKPTNDEYYFKKSHSYSYAMAIKVQINLIVEEISQFS